ncbi:monocarboxylate transporter 9-like [Galleria mellonella]|uniref:Monocarboxylate transporter 9-like n=1 Tax=Galleria mellonella TaxID=7137 RepID=A0A6J1X7R8_GALME|nr:monocarboxylate transporter 9-like [Galleria mellonella]
MPPKVIASKLGNEPNKNVLIIPSRIISRPDQLEGGEETEIAAQILLPEEGGWGWVVVIASFCSIFILDGVTFTFGSIFKNMKEDLGESESLIALINSLSVALYFLASPIASAFINRFGFRLCVMSGSVIASSSLFCSYFATNYVSLCVFYGGFAGFGFSLINVSASLIVSFYFEKLRSLALSLASSGSSVGIMIMFPINSYLVKLAGWRAVTLLHTGLFGVIYFLGMTFKPLLSLTVVKTTDDPTRTVTYLPNLSTAGVKSTSGVVSTATERLFSAVSNVNFPTAASVVHEGILTSSNQPGLSTAALSKLTLTAHSPQSGISKRQLKQVQSIMSRTSAKEQDKTKNNIEVTVNIEQPKKRSWWTRLCHWEEHTQQARPLYRDDFFYEGKIENLPVYQKSMIDTTAEDKTGLEYQLAVSRAATTADLRERRGVFTTAARRVLATMLDPKLLKKCSFLFLCSSGCLTYMGLLVPYVFIQDRNTIAGLDPAHTQLFVSAIGLANSLGRLVMGTLACKIDPVKLYMISCCISGVSTIFSDVSYSVYYQYSYCFVFGFFIASLASLRSMVIVALYGLENLTNGTGMLLMFQGCGSLVSTPIAGVVKNNFGYSVAFYVAGIFMTISGFLIIPLRKLSVKENEIDNATRKNCYESK